MGIAFDSPRQGPEARAETSSSLLDYQSAKGKGKFLLPFHGPVHKHILL